MTCSRHRSLVLCFYSHTHTHISCSTVRFWDLELFKCVGVTAPEATAVRCISFDPEGDVLYSGGSHSFRVCRMHSDKGGTSPPTHTHTPPLRPCRPRSLAPSPSPSRLTAGSLKW